MNWIVHSLIKNWFLCGIVLGILLAWADPEIGMKGGPLHPEITIKYFGLFLKIDKYNCSYVLHDHLECRF